MSSSLTETPLDNLLSSLVTPETYVLLENFHSFGRESCQLNVLKFNSAEIVAEHIINKWFADLTYEDMSSRFDYVFDISYDETNFRVTTHIDEGDYVIYTLYKGERTILKKIIRSIFSQLPREV